MATAILMSSATVASSGSTISVPTSGSNGTLSPTSAITGFSVTVNGLAYTTSAATASAATVTLTTTQTVPIGAIVTLTLSTGSNLTDSASHTPVGQTGFPATNNAAVVPDPSNVRITSVYDNGNKIGTLVTNAPYLVKEPSHSTPSTATIGAPAIKLIDQVYGISVPLHSNASNDISISSSASNQR